MEVMRVPTVLPEMTAQEAVTLPEMTAQEAMTLPGLEVHQMTVPEITAQTMDLMMTVPETEVIMQMRTPEMGMIQDINSI